MKAKLEHMLQELYLQQSYQILQLLLINREKLCFKVVALQEKQRAWGTSSNKTTNKLLAKGDTLPADFALSVLGSDETGTGDFFGPITVAACFVSADQVELVKFLGVKDSKMLTDDLMRKIAPDLKATLTYSVLILAMKNIMTYNQRVRLKGK